MARRCTKCYETWENAYFIGKSNTCSFCWNDFTYERFTAEQRRAIVTRAQSKRRARVRGLAYVPYSRHIVWLRDGGKCGMCKEVVEFGRMCLDHIIPIAADHPDNPGDVPWNVRPSHRACNSRKKATYGDEEWAEVDRLKTVYYSEYITNKEDT